MQMISISSLGLLVLLYYTSPGTELVLAKPAKSAKKPKEWQNDPKCGFPKFKPATGGRIVGGTNARAHSWPWQALFLCQDERQSLNCGATLIASRWVITAAHCVTAVLEKMNVEQNCVIMLGKHHVQREEAPQQTSLISKYVIHPDYSIRHPQRGNDVALLKLDKEMSYSAQVQPACLPFGLSELTNESKCFATGWGRFIAERGDMAPELKQLHMPIENPIDLCGIDAKYASGHVCAGHWQRGQDVCSGDSGGPLTCKEASGKWYLHGVTSLGDMLCRSYGIFAKVTAFKEWIERTANKD